jgi:hypothetical protein
MISRKENKRWKRREKNRVERERGRRDEVGTIEG